jgi:hypothetical protein
MTSGFQTGYQLMQQAIKQGKSSGGGGSPRLDRITWKDGERKIVRFLTDEAITADWYEFIATNDGKTRGFLINPQTDWVAKYASPTPGVGWRRNPKTGNIEDRVRRRMGVTVAVLREEKPAGNGRTVVEDHIYDLDINDTTYKARLFGVIQQSMTFFDQITGFFERYGTTTDRDYQITRKGGGFDTHYQIVPLDPIEEMRDKEVVQKFYGYDHEWPKNPHKDDQGNPVENPPAKAVEAWNHRFLFCPQTLMQWAENESSEDKAKYWLGAKEGESTPQVGFAQPAAADEAQAQVAVPTDTVFASLRESLLSNKD